MNLDDLLSVNNGPIGQVVPNVFPRMEFETGRLAIIGEAPGEEEVKQGAPFVGSSGYILDKMLQAAQIPRAGCFVGNVCQVRPPGNIIEKFLWHGPEIQGGLEQLRKDLQTYQPNLCLLLGKTPLRAALGVAHVSILDWRGSLFRCVDPTSPMFGFKCLASIHPAALLRMYDYKPLLRFDMQRAKEEMKSRELHLPKRNLRTFLSAYECIERLNNIKDGDLIALDIEGGVTQGIKCVSFATDPLDVFIVAFTEMTLEEECMVIKAVAKVLTNPKIGKVLQNALYDQFVFAYLYGIVITNIVHDTMLSGWEIYPELPKALETQTSIWTREPYYKDQFDSNDKWKFYEYCCKDSAVTLEIALRHRTIFARDPAKNAHFQFNMRMLKPLMYMELKGMRYDKELAIKRHAQACLEVEQVQSRINSRLVAATGQSGYTLNPDSPKQTCFALYDVLKLPVQHPKVGNAYDRTKRTADAGAMLKLAKATRDPICFDILSYRHWNDRRGVLELVPDKDNRSRSTYNGVGSKTGRVTAAKAPTGNGMNLQTVTNDLRDLFLPDEGYHMFQCDLAGADGWTVAAECKSLGDPTMLDDYLYGLKPAKILALLYKNGSRVNTWTRQQLKEASKEISEKGAEGWLYFACKRVQHGTNYLLGPETMSQQILEDSYKKMGRPIDVPISECKKLQAHYLGRYYGVQYWQAKVKRQITTDGYLTAASGHVRRFFGRPDNTTFQAAVAQNPQANTTYATNTAILRLCDDPENVDDNGDWIIQPLHQVHDALVGQFPIGMERFASLKIPEWFCNPMTIAGVTLTIPFDGGYGPNWKECKIPFEI